MARLATPKQKRFVKLLLADPNGDHVAAARGAGYRYPSEVGSKLLRTLAPLIEAERGKRSDVKSLAPQDVIRLLESIAQNPEHRDQYNALKTLVAVLRIDAAPVDRSAIRAEILEYMQTLRISDSQHPQLKPSSESQPRLTRTKPV